MNNNTPSAGNAAKAPFGEESRNQIDVRLYIGMLFFRWKAIVVCFLYALLGGVLYLNFVTPQYRARGVVSVSRDPDLTVTRAGAEWGNPVTHARMLSSGALRARAIDALAEEWSEIVGGRRNMALSVDARTSGSRVQISARSPHREYAIAFVNKLMDLHASQWQGSQQSSLRGSLERLERELALTEEKIEEAELDVIDYRRLNDLVRESIRKGIEKSFIQGIISKRIGLETRLFMLETANPEIKDANFGVIGNVERLTEAAVTDDSELLAGGLEDDDDEDVPTQFRGDEAWIDAAFARSSTGDRKNPDENTKENSEDPELPETGWVRLRLRLVELEQQREDLLKDVEAAHPRVRALDRQIRSAYRNMEAAAELKRANLRDRHKAMLITLKTLEAVEYRWQSKQLDELVKTTELTRLQHRVDRYRDSYRLLSTRFHELMVAEETKPERLSISNRAGASRKPEWPDSTRILLISVLVGLGSGLGLAVGLQFLDNRIQTIKDVEQGLDMTFLGGVPYWVHSGLERTIRPIVTEEHSTGAVEAYRALRTTITNELAKQNEKTVFITSADSREGKTLTSLNLAIMTAQMGKRVLLIDMDLRRGRLHRSLGQEREPGVTDALASGRALKDVVQSTRIEGLDLVPSGGSVGGSAELLQTTNVLGALVELQDDYDYIYVDTSPVLRVTDTVILATQGIGVVVYVARVNHTPKPLIRYSLDMLKEANVLGLIMNSIEMHRISSLYYAYQYPNYAYYSNAYAYGYNYYHYGEQKGKAKKFHRQAALSRAGRGINRWFRETFFPME